METFSALLALWAGNSPVTGEFPTQKPVTRSFDFFYLRLNKLLSKQSWNCWFETPSRSLWRHCNAKHHYEYHPWQSSVTPCAVNTLIETDMASITGLHVTLIPTSISNCTLYKVWDQITYSLPNFNGCSVDVWEWISNFIPHLTGYVITYPCWLFVLLYSFSNIHVHAPSNNSR